MLGLAQRDGHGRPTEDRIAVRELVPGCRMFAVFDGHGGSGTSEILKTELGDRIKEAIEARGPGWIENAEDLLKRVFLEMDQNLAGPPSRVRGSGAVATVALVVGGQVIVAWVGDSPVVLLDSKSGEVLRVTRAHHPSEPDEAERIRGAGGQIIKDGMGVPRVDGGLMISRAFGDFTYKWNTRSQKPPPPGDIWSNFKVTAMPEVERWSILPHHVLILSSDGLLEGPEYSALHPRTVGERVYVALTFGKSLAEVAEDLLDQHIAKAEAPYDGDDLSVILVTGLGPAPRGGGKRRPQPRKTRRVRKGVGSSHKN